MSKQEQVVNIWPRIAQNQEPYCQTSIVGRETSPEVNKKNNHKLITNIHQHKKSMFRREKSITNPYPDDKKTNP